MPEIERLARDPEAVSRLVNTDARRPAAGFDGYSFWRRGYTRMERNSFTNGGASATYYSALEVLTSLQPCWKLGQMVKRL